MYTILNAVYLADLNVFFIFTIVFVEFKIILPYAINVLSRISNYNSNLYYCVCFDLFFKKMRPIT